ncbi:MAG: hypothetical protein ACK46X_00585 [Candidatus Sericytochromatia bacterium]
MAIAKHGMWLAVLALAGCQAPVALHQWRQPLFALGADAPSSAVPVQVGVRPAVSGDLTVTFSGELAALRQRSVLATVADVDRVVVTVKPNGAAEVSQTVQKAAIANGQTTVTFSGLPVGDAVVTITAYDASGASIGSTTKTAAVTAGQVATVGVSLQLAPTYTGVGGGSAPTTGGLSAQVTLTDGVNVPGPAQATGQIIGSYPLDFYPVALTADRDGDVWVGGGQKVVKMAPDGTVRATLQVATPVNSMAVDAQGFVWVLEHQGNPYVTLSKFDRTGHKLGEWETVAGGGSCQLTVAVDGSLFIANGFSGGFYRWDPVTATLTRLTIGPNLGTMAQSVVTDPQGNVLLLVFDGASQKLLRFAPDGTKQSEVTLTVSASDLAIDGLGQPWVSFYGDVHKLRPDGSLIRTVSGFALTNLGYDMAQHMDFDAQNQGWMLSDAGLKRVGPDGTVLGTYAVPAKTERVSVGPAGVWTNTRNQTGTSYVTLTAF